LRVPVGADVAATALEDGADANLLDAAAGHVWHAATGTASEQLWLTVNAVSPTATTATTKATNPSAALSINAAGLIQLFITPTGAAGGAINWGLPLFVVSPTGTATAVVSATGFISKGPVTFSNTVTASGFFTTVSGSAVAGVSTPTATATDGFLYIPQVASTPTGTPTVQPGYVALVATSWTAYLNPGGTSVWTVAGTQVPQTIVVTQTGTVTITAGAKAAWVRIVGGGGGGGGGNTGAGAGGGGGAGAYSEKLITSPTVSYLVTIGSGGSGGGANSPGNPGGASSFGSVITAVSGGLGGSAGGSQGGSGAVTSAAGSGGDMNFAGAGGGTGLSNSTSGVGGHGGNSVFGGGAGGSSGNAGAGTGSGGSGGSSGGTSGGNGATATCYVVLFF